MTFRQLTHDDLGCASYLVGDEHAGVAAVVDPRLDILKTHNHADHVSGHGRLAAATGATIHTPGHRPEHTAFALVDSARGMFASLNDKLLTLPDTCEVWPGHLGGSLCGGPGMDLKVSSTIGFERAHQSLLQIDDEDEDALEAAALAGSVGLGAIAGHLAGGMTSWREDKLPSSACSA